MSYELKDEIYKGHTLKIVSDDDAQPPDDCDDAGAFLVAGHSDCWIPPPGMKDERSPEAWLERFEDTHWKYPIEAYIHSGVVLARSSCGGFPDRRWDVSNPVGFVFLSKEEWKTRDSKKANKYCDSLIETWNQYLSGDVWGYVVEHEESGWEDSCWGFMGDEYCEQEARSSIDWHVEDLRKKKIEQVKTWIRNEVPLAVRQAAML